MLCDFVEGQAHCAHMNPTIAAAVLGALELAALFHAQVLALVLVFISLGGPRTVPWTVINEAPWRARYGLLEALAQGRESPVTYDELSETCDFNGQDDVCDVCEAGGKATLAFVIIGILVHVPFAGLLLWKHFGRKSPLPEITDTIMVRKGVERGRFSRDRFSSEIFGSSRTRATVLFTAIFVLLWLGWHGYCVLLHRVHCVGSNVPRAGGRR